MFKTETHLHTAEVSGCAEMKASAMVKSYYEAGYKTLVITDHLSSGSLIQLGDITWEEKVTIFLYGYYKAVRASVFYPVNVLLGAEITLDGMPNDYLCYGVTKQFLLDHPDIVKYSLEELKAAAEKYGVLVIQAHPCRDNMCYPTFDFVDGAEIYNSNPRHANYTDKVEAALPQRPFFTIGGSDAHRSEDVALSGIATEDEIKTSRELIDVIRSGKFDIIGKLG